MERLGGQQTGETQSIRQVVAASFIGTTIEWYDFFLYGSAAALIFGQLFFPYADPLVGTLASFGIYGVGFVVRPVGGIIFGHYGDRIGRKTMLVISLMMMGISTFFIGLLPTADTIGIWAPVLLVVLRTFQGLGVGGEWGGAVLLAVEHSPEGRRGFYGSWAQMGVPAGLLLSNGVLFPLASLLPQEEFFAWGWRVPFLASIVLVGVGLFIRLRILETPVFRRVQETHTEAQMPIVDVVRYYPKNILLALGMRLAQNTNFIILTVFVLSYVTQQLGLPQTTALLGVIIAAVVSIFTTLGFGALSDSLGRRRVYMFGAVFSLIFFAAPFFWLMDTATPVLIWLAIALGLALGHDPMYGPQAAYFSELFGTRLRYSGASIGYQLGAVVTGVAPLIATSLLAWTGGHWWLIAVYMVLLSLITIVATYLASETYEEDITAERPEERQAIAGEPT